MNVKTIIDSELAGAVRHGLSRKPKSLPSWLFYDDLGDKIFRKIMRMPEYYPTRCEYDILKNHKRDLRRYFSRDDEPFQLIELGAGDGLKTEILLEYFHANHVKFSYVPVDISENALKDLAVRLKRRFTGLNINPINKNYLKALDEIMGDEKKVLLFLGANIGNFTIHEALNFVRSVAAHLQYGDLALVGFDLKKDPRIVAEAYDDKRGITKEFNLNMLHRLNRELNANFSIKNFEHYAAYDPETGAAKSFLISLNDQEVYIEALNKSFLFLKWETINTEISQKYDLPMIAGLFTDAGMKIRDLFLDDNNYFCDVLAAKA